MTITTTTLTRTAGLAAVAAGALFILIQFIHPSEDVASVATTAWTVVHTVSITMAVLALVGITGTYLRQVERAGILGLVGYVLFSTCFLVIAMFTFVEAYVLPLLTEQVPRFVEDVVAVPAGGTVVGDVGALQTVSLVSFATYLLGGLLFGIALYRAGQVHRWAAVTLAVGAVCPLLLAVLPHAPGRLAAVPAGIALIGLGHSTWRGTTRRGETAARRSAPSARRRRQLTASSGR